MSPAWRLAPRAQEPHGNGLALQKCLGSCGRQGSVQSPHKRALTEATFHSTPGMRWHFGLEPSTIKYLETDFGPSACRTN